MPRTALWPSFRVFNMLNIATKGPFCQEVKKDLGEPFFYFYKSIVRKEQKKSCMGLLTAADTKKVVLNFLREVKPRGKEYSIRTFQSKKPILCPINQ